MPYEKGLYGLQLDCTEYQLGAYVALVTNDFDFTTLLGGAKLLSKALRRLQTLYPVA